MWTVAKMRGCDTQNQLRAFRIVCNGTCCCLLPNVKFSLRLQAHKRGRGCPGHGASRSLAGLWGPGQRCANLGLVGGRDPKSFRKTRMLLEAIRVGEEGKGLMPAGVKDGEGRDLHGIQLS